MKIKNFFKENKDLLLYSLLITIFVCIPLFKSGIMCGHDMSFHLSRFTGIITSLQDHQMPIAIYPYKNFAYGYASPLFYSDLFLIIPALIVYFTPISLITMYKILLFIIAFFTAFFTMFTINKIFKNKKAAIVSAIILMGSEYYLVDLHLRSAFGELLATCLLPLLIYYIYLFVVEEKENYLSLGIMFALILNSHNISFLLSVASFAIFMLFNIKKFINNKKMILTLLKATLIGILFSSAFLIPMIEQYTAQYLRVHWAIVNDFGADAIKLSEFVSDFFSQYEFKFNNHWQNTYVGSIKNLGLLCSFIPFIYLFTKKKNKYINQILCIFIIYMYMSSEFFPIEKISIFRFIQFSPRLYIIVPFLVVYIVAYSMNNFMNNKNMIVLGVVCIYTIVNSMFLFTGIISDAGALWFEEKATAKEIFDEGKYWWYPPENDDWNWYEIGRAEYLPDRYYSFPKEGKCLDDENSIQISCEYERVGTNLTFTLDLDEDKAIQLPLSWYKGYHVKEIDKDGNVIQEFETYSSFHRSRLTFNALKGKHTYTSKYENTIIQKASLALNILSIIVVSIYEIKKRKKWNIN